MPKGWKLISFYDKQTSPNTFHVSIPHYTGERDKIGDEFDKILEGDITIEQIIDGLSPFLKLTISPEGGSVK
jgi:hypothetical protein